MWLTVLVFHDSVVFQDGPLPPLFGEPMPLPAAEVDGDPVDLSAPARLHGLARLDPEHDPGE